MEEGLVAILEFVFEVFGQVLFELGFRGIAEVFRGRDRQGQAVAFVGYALCGLVAGGLSLLLFPRSFIRRRSLRIANLVVSPLLAGLVMAGLGAYQERQGRLPLRLDSFRCGAVFALGTTLVRFVFADH